VSGLAVPVLLPLIEVDWWWRPVTDYLLDGEEHEHSLVDKADNFIFAV